MHKFGVFLVALAIAATVEAPFALAARERVHARDRDRGLSLNDPRSLASPNYRGYRPAWANPYAEPEELGVNDDPTPFYPSDVDSGPNPLDPDAF
jgi:hypothetical protein